MRHTISVFHGRIFLISPGTRHPTIPVSAFLLIPCSFFISNFFRKTMMLILVGATLIINTQCTRSLNSGKITRDPHSSSGYWIGDHTYCYSAAADPKRGLSDKMARRASSFKRAVENARHLLRQRFIGMSQEMCPGPMLNDPEAVEAARLVSEIIKNGKIVKTEYDTDDNCEVLFQVTHSNLKTIVYKAAWKRE